MVIHTSQPTLESAIQETLDSFDEEDTCLAIRNFMSHDIVITSQ